MTSNQFWTLLLVIAVPLLFAAYQLEKISETLGEMFAILKDIQKGR